MIIGFLVLDNPLIGGIFLELLSFRVPGVHFLKHSVTDELAFWRNLVVRMMNFWKSHEENIILDHVRFVLIWLNNESSGNEFSSVDESQWSSICNLVCYFMNQLLLVKHNFFFKIYCFMNLHALIIERMRTKELTWRWSEIINLPRVEAVNSIRACRESLIALHETVKKCK